MGHLASHSSLLVILVVLLIVAFLLSNWSQPAPNVARPVYYGYAFPGIGVLVVIVILLILLGVI
jgi:hypothetical protein